MAIRFIYLEKAMATIPREMTMGTLEWVGVPEGEVRLVRRESYLSTKQGGTNKKIGISISLEQ